MSKAGFSTEDAATTRASRSCVGLFALVVLRATSIPFLVSGVASGLASMGVLFTLDYDVDVGGGVPWSNFGIRMLIGIGLIVPAAGFWIIGAWLWGLGGQDRS